MFVNLTFYLFLTLNKQTQKVHKLVSFFHYPFKCLTVLLSEKRNDLIRFWQLLLIPSKYFSNFLLIFCSMTFIFIANDRQIRKRNKDMVIKAKQKKSKPRISLLLRTLGYIKHALRAALLMFYIDLNFISCTQYYYCMLR